MLKDRIGILLSQAQRVRRGLHRRLAPGPYRSHIDGIIDGQSIAGWVFARDRSADQITVGLYAGDTLLDSATANRLRLDVQHAFNAPPTTGFAFVLSDTLSERIAKTDGSLTIRTMGDRPVVLGTLDVPVPTQEAVPTLTDIEAARRVLADDLSALRALLARLPGPGEAAPPPLARPPLTNHGLLFTTAPLMPEVAPSGQPAYLDYVRYRYRMDEVYQVEPGLESQDRYLYWYLTAYRAQERHRVPLSREQIDYLNAPIVMAGQSFSLTRAMWWRIAGRPDMLGRLNFNNRDDYIAALFWWAHQDVTHLYFEDCLVPDRIADLLRGVHPSRRLDAYPLSYFTERLFLDSPALHFLKPGTAEGRKVLVLALMLRAARRPDLLRYIPRRSLAQLLAPNPDNPQGASDFALFVNDLAQARGTEHAAERGDDAPDWIALDRARYAAALRLVDFDLDSFSFVTRDQNGHRYAAAALPMPDMTRPRVDVQLIGPLSKASGLGQATRLSAEILRETDMSVRGVGFDLDNPAPEGFSSDTLIEEHGPARINLIHLNAESTPLAFAYQPDVFSGAYNIGYFFWELDRPAYCHYLGMEMLDEIWVSTDYCVEIYQRDAKGKPVVNVGMCYEDVGEIDRRAARDYVNRRFRLDDSAYVCLVAFDSFSFVQRKNPVSVLKAFQQAFRGVPQARLVVKTQNRDSVWDPIQTALWDRVDAMVAADPRIMVMNETLSYRELLDLKAGSDCYVSLHKSEGWGFGMIEAMNLGVPVICTGYSGNMDFCTSETAWLVDYTLVPLQKQDYIFVRPGSVWAEPDVDDAARQMRAAFDDPVERARRATAARDAVRTSFSRQAIARRYGDRLHEILKGLPDG